MCLNLSKCHSCFVAKVWQNKPELVRQAGNGWRVTFVHGYKRKGTWPNSFMWQARDESVLYTHYWTHQKPDGAISMFKSSSTRATKSSSVELISLFHEWATVNYNVIFIVLMIVLFSKWKFKNNANKAVLICSTISQQKCNILLKIQMTFFSLN